jgi:hypothetical protein
VDETEAKLKLYGQIYYWPKNQMHMTNEELTHN